MDTIREGWRKVLSFSFQRPDFDPELRTAQSIQGKRVCKEYCDGLWCRIPAGTCGCLRNCYCGAAGNVCGSNGNRRYRVDPEAKYKPNAPRGAIKAVVQTDDMPYTYSCLSADLARQKQAVGGTKGTPHGLRVLGYNRSRHGNGIDLTVAHGGSKRGSS